MTWYSSNEAYATVDNNGVVTAISPGVAIIIASITVDGVTYDDDATVEVEAAPIEYQTIFDFTSDEFFFDESNWIQKDYDDTSRETFYTKAQGRGDPLRLCYSEEGAPSSLYTDFRIAMQDVTGWDWDVDKRYALRVELMPQEQLEDWNFAFKLTTAGDNFFVSASGDTVINSNTEETFVPLDCRGNITLPRLMSLQIRKETPSGNYFADCAAVLELVELL